MSPVPSCIFCAIVAGRAPCEQLFEDADTLAFMDIHPANDGHCLVIPKAHRPTVFDIVPAEFAAVARTLVRVGGAVRQALHPAGLSLVQANGVVAGQSVMHLHVHVLPRREGDELSINWSRSNPGDSARIAALAEQFRRHL